MTGSELQRLIQEAKLKQESAAILCGVSLRTMQRWIAGEHKTPKPAERLLLLLRDKPRDIIKYLDAIGED